MNRFWEFLGIIGLAVTLAYAKDSDNKTHSIDPTRLDALDLSVNALHSGRPVITGHPSFQGGIKINDGTQGNGYVLTSNASGEATWQAGTASTTNAFGSWTSKIIGTVYQAATDGYVLCTLHENTNETSSAAQIFGYSDASNPPTTLRANASTSYRTAGSNLVNDNSFTMTVRGSDYYKVTINYSYGTSAGVDSACYFISGIAGIIGPTGPTGSTGNTSWTVSGNNQYSSVSGNVGIGVTSPAQKLDIAATGKIAFGGVSSLSQNGPINYAWSQSGGGSWRVINGAGNTDLLTILDTGNITAPNPLHAQSFQSSGTINVRYVGATGNGTTDDTAAFKLAVSTLVAGQTLYIPCGHYYLSDEILTTKAINIIGDGACSQIYQSASTTAFRVDGGAAQNVNGGIIRGLYIASDKTAPGSALLYLHNANRYTISDIILGGGYDGIWCRGCEVNGFYNIRSFNNIGGFFNGAASATNNAHAWMRFDDDLTNLVAQNGNFIYNQIAEGGMNGLVVIDVIGQGNISVYGGTYEGMASTGIYVSGISGASSINGGYFEGNKQDIYIESGVHDFLISGIVQSSTITINGATNTKIQNILTDSIYINAYSTGTIVENATYHTSAAGQYVDNGYQTHSQNIRTTSSIYTYPPAIFEASGGNIGIGITGPGQQLDIAAAGAIGFGGVKHSSQNGPINYSWSQSGGGSWRVVNGVGNTDLLTVMDLGDVIVPYETTFKSTVTIQGNAFSVGASTFSVSAGNVGIGISGPTSPLHVVAATGNIYAVTTSSGINMLAGCLNTVNGLVCGPVSGPVGPTGATGSIGLTGATGGVGTTGLTGATGIIGLVGSKATQNVLVYNSASQANTISTFTVTPGGNVGIGTASPAAKLDVNGNGNFTSGIIGFNSSGDATTGNMGEYISSSSVVFGNFPATGVTGDLLNISLTAGDWDISLIGQVYNNNATMNKAACLVGIGTASGNSLAGVTDYNSFYISATMAGGDQAGVSVPSWRASISGTTTYYYKYLCTYTGGPPQLDGMIRARRSAH